MTSRLSRAAALAAGPLLTVALLVPSASADVWVIHDATGDGSGGTSGGEGKWGDIGTVRVGHGARYVWLTIRPAPGGGPADFYDVWVDTKRTDPGPEFVVSVSAEVSKWTSVRRAGRWGRLGGPRVCEVPTLQGPGYDGLVRMAVPRRCLRTDGAIPKRIRVAVRTTMEYTLADWAPGVRSFGRWVTAG